MTYEKIFTDVRKAFIKADTNKLDYDFAYQCNITGDGEGVFYVAYKNSVLEIQPYDYADKNGTLYANGEIFIRIANGVLSFDKAVRDGLLKIEGDTELAYEIGKLSRDKTEAGKKINKAETAAKLEEKAMKNARKSSSVSTRKPAIGLRRNDITDDDFYDDYNVIEAANFIDNMDMRF